MSLLQLQQNSQTIEKMYVQAMDMAQPQQQDDMVGAQAAVWGCIWGFIDTMALKCAIQLGIPDIISSHGHPISLTEIAEGINYPSLDSGRLCRVMTLLVRRGIFTASPSESDTVYSLTPASKLLLSISEERRLAEMALLHGSESAVSLWQHLGDCVKDGGSAFTKRFGMDGWSYMAANPQHSEMLHRGLAGISRIVLEALKIGYLEDGLEGVGTLVDVGGGSGFLVGEIVKLLPNIKGINFDLPFVVADAPQYTGVTHVAGDMLTSVPSADAILLKEVLHNWDDKNCIKILTNCHEAVPKESGKVIIIDVVLNPYGKDPLDDTRLRLDLHMMLCHGSQERTEGDWKRLLEGAGFSRYNIIKIPTTLSLIEAYP